MSKMNLIFKKLHWKIDELPKNEFNEYEFNTYRIFYNK